MKYITINVTEQESWVLFTALLEYSKNPTNDEHGKLAEKMATDVKNKILSSILPFDEESELDDIMDDSNIPEDFGTHQYHDIG